jgi:ubiquinone/menaquinone biosynthesis C-methylase UbiE
MEKEDLFHPRVFDDKEWAAGYYKRNAKNIKRTGKRLAAVLEKSGFDGGKVLDAGCGFGAVTTEIAKKFRNSVIIGIDLADPLLKIANDLSENEGVSERISFLKGDVLEVDFPDDEFDLTISSYMMHIVERPVDMLNEIERVTKPGGRIMITDLRRMWLGVFVKKLKTTFTLDEAVVIIKKSNLREGKASKGPFWWDYFTGL